METPRVGGAQSWQTCGATFRRTWETQGDPREVGHTRCRQDPPRGVQATFTPDEERNHMRRQILPLTYLGGLRGRGDDSPSIPCSSWENKDPCRINPPRKVVNWSTTRLAPRGLCHRFLSQESLALVESATKDALFTY